jgi:2-polyprenyl-6-methoxyphenol hydroxylase-like FAD-dependent oxidoreductase
MLLARDGHDVVVLERDADDAPASPADAWERWTRGGVAQFRQPHYLHPGARRVLDAELPDVRDALLAAGALQFDTLLAAPPTLPRFERRPDDARFATITARRAAIEQVFARAAAAEPRLSIRRGVAAKGLATRDRPEGPQVVGVETGSGETVRADLVVDAMGRRSALPEWLRERGAAPVHEEAEDSGFVYYTRYFRAPSPPEIRDRLLAPIGSISLLTLPADNGIRSVTVVGSSRDRPLTALRDTERWTKVVAACPLQAHWLDGEPITDVLPMAGILDRCRRLVADGRPIATGVALVADACACTNPSLGRGITLGLSHAARLRDVARAELSDPTQFAAAWDAVTESELMPWYRATVALDRARLAQIEAVCAQRELPRPEGPAAMGDALARAMARDPEIFRAFTEIVGCLSLPRDLFARPGFAERVMEVAGSHGHAVTPGPTREELLRLLA